MLKIAICDDEQYYTDRIRALIEAHKFFKYCEIDTFTDAESLKLKGYGDFDIFVLDIEIDGTSGVEVASQIKTVNPDALVIFVTCYSQYISEALSNSAFQYILKPIDEKLFAREFSRAVETIRKKRSVLPVRHDAETDFVRVGDVAYIENSNRKLIYRCTDGRVYAGKGSLSALAEKLAPYNFARCHCSYLVNVANISRIERYELTLTDKTFLPISKKYYSDLREAFREYISGIII